MVDQALMSGVWPCWVTHSWLEPVQVPMPSITAKTAGVPCVHCSHSACMLASLVGSNWTMIGLILRPLIPPAWLIWSTKRLMAGICSLYSLSSAKPSLPARLLTATTGKTTLMDVLETPRSLVLAWLTGVDEDEDVEARSTGTAAPALPPPPGVPAGASTSQAMSPTTMATTISTVRSCMPRGRRRRRRHDRPIGAQGRNVPP